MQLRRRRIVVPLFVCAAAVSFAVARSRSVSVWLDPERAEGGAARVAGSVSRIDHGAIPAGLRVVAVPDGLHFECGDTLGRGIAAKGGVSSGVAGDGSFRLALSAPGGPHEVTAAGPGWVAGTRVVTSDGTALLEIEPLYGVRVELVEAGGTPLASNARLYWARGTFEARCMDPEARDLNGRPFELSLAGVDACADPTRDVQVLCFSARTERERVGPIELRIDVPGYAPRRTEVWAHRMSGAPHVERVELKRTAKGFGAVVVRIAQRPETGFEPAPGTKSLAALRWDNGEGRLGILGIPAFAGDETRLDGIPFGTYATTFMIAGGAFEYPSTGGPRTLTIGEQDVALDVDMSEAGSLWVDIADARGAAVEGPVTLRLSRPGIRGIERVAFSKGPYVIPGIAPGEYDIVALIGGRRAVAGRARWSARASIQARELLALTLMPDK